jgi:hypothetical protein
MKKVTVLLTVFVFLAGCAWLKQVNSDYQLGKSTPLAVNETSPADKAAAIKSSVEAIPVPWAGSAATAIGFLATILFTWQRGSQIRKTGAPSTTSTTVNVVTGTVQNIADVLAGAFTMVGPNATTTGTVLQRIWKVGLAIVASGAVVASANTSFMAYLTAHPILSASFVAISSAVAGLEKAMSNVPTVTTPSA